MMASLDSTSRKALERLALRVVEHAVLPFCGAGLSYGAQHRDGWASTPGRMPDAIEAVLRGHLNAVSTTPNDWPNRTLRETFAAAAGCDKESFKRDGKLSRSLDKLAELLTVVAGPIATCEAAQIADYALFKPEPAHVYLAWLAREGVIGEIVTTNYDCAIETAFRHSFDDPETASRQLAVITHLEAYRWGASSHQRPGRLILYKINGCADEFANTPRTDRAAMEKAAERIVLTERQLQTFRDQGWAHDLFKDRARTRALLFCGFGSEEPQIRHTAMALMEEFGRNGGVDDADVVMGLPNAPFLHSYEGVLSFTQMQVMLGFLHAHRKPIIDPQVPDADLKIIYRNVIAPAPGAHGEGETDKLSSSAFFFQLFTEVYRLLIERRTRPWLERWLADLAPCHRLWSRHLSDLARSPPDEAGAAGQSLAKLLTFGPKGTAPPLMRLLYAMRHPGVKNSPREWCLPMREEPIQVGAVLLLLALSGRMPEPDDVPRLNFVDKEPGGVQVEVELVDAVGIQRLEDAALPSGRSRLRRLLAVPRLDPGPVDARLTRLGARAAGGAPASLFVGRVAVAPLEEVIRAAEKPDRFAATLCDAFAAARPRSKARLIPLGVEQESGA